MKTLIVSAFPACGKTALFLNQSSSKFKVCGEDKTFSFLDSDSSKFPKVDEW